MNDTFICALHPLTPDTVQRLAMQSSRKWIDRTTLRVRFLDGDPDLHFYVAQLIEGPRGWNATCAMQFVFGDDPAAEIRVSFAQGPTSWSQLGNDALWVHPDQPTMNLSVRIEDAGPHIDRPINHEFGHALGFVHGQQSPLAGAVVEEAVYRYYRERGWSDSQIRSQVLARLDRNDAEAISDDVRSVMYYVMPGELWADGRDRESSAYPTYWDAYAAETWYGPPPANYTSVVLPFAARS